MKSLMDLLGKDGSDSAGDTSLSRGRSGDNLQPEESLGDDTAQMGFQTAADDAYHAVKSGDVDGFRTALQAAIEMAR